MIKIKDIKTYNKMNFSGEKYKAQEVTEGEASVLEIIEWIGKKPLKRIRTQSLENFRNGKIDEDLPSELLIRLRKNLSYFKQKGYRNINEFVFLKQLEINLEHDEDFFRFDDIYFTSVYSTDRDGHIRMISYGFTEDGKLPRIIENILMLSNLEILDLHYNQIIEPISVC